MSIFSSHCCHDSWVVPVARQVIRRLRLHILKIRFVLEGLYGCASQVRTLAWILSSLQEGKNEGYVYNSCSSASVSSSVCRRFCLEINENAFLSSFPGFSVSHLTILVIVSLNNTLLSCPLALDRSKRR
jgi:hypothetical protein